MKNIHVKFKFGGTRKERDMVVYPRSSDDNRIIVQGDDVIAAFDPETGIGVYNRINGPSGQACSTRKLSSRTTVSTSVSIPARITPNLQFKSGRVYNLSMSCKSDAYASIAWCHPTQEIIVTFNSGAVWAYPAKVQEYAMMHRRNVSAGRYLNNVLKKRGGRLVKARPQQVQQLPLVSAEVAALSQQFMEATGLLAKEPVHA